MRKVRVRAGEHLALSLQEIRCGTGFERGAHFVQVPYEQDWRPHLDSLPLVAALWWFIENIDGDHPQRDELFFHLRDRYRREA